MSHVSNCASGLSARIKKGSRGSAGRVRLQAVPVEEAHVVASNLIMSGDRDRGAELPDVPSQSLVQLDEEMGRLFCLGLSLGNPGLIQVPM